MRIPVPLRDQLITRFREQVCETIGIVPFTYQREWWAATDGKILMPHLHEETDHVRVRLPDDSYSDRSLVPRPNGRARTVAVLAAYKGGKSFGAALWATGFAAVPDARVYLVGIEYDMCAPEFEYLLEFLLSDRGLALKPKVLQNRPKDGRLWLELDNGARFEARSWERSENLKGKEVDAYIFCEAYQLPGIECFMGIKQNLRARQGYAIFPTTPDSPWIATLHENGHSHPDYPDWQCFCGIPASVNPYTYDVATEALDQRLMTKEKYNIAYLGKIGAYVGSVFGYQRGERVFNTETHPELWYSTERPADRANLRIPPNWTVQVGADTGTYFGAVVVAFDEVGDAYVLDELPNYRYVAQTIELDEDISLTGWADRFKRMTVLYGARDLAWVDTNSQFKDMMWRDHHIHLLGNNVGREMRTEATRSYFQHGRIWLAPWLHWLPFELEHAQWPPEATSAGRFERVKHNDHLIDGLEHLCSRRPIGKKPPEDPKIGFPTRHESPKPRNTGDPHLGRL